MSRILPGKFEILIDGQSPKEFFDALDKKIDALRQTEIGYGTKVKMTSKYGWTTGKITEIHTTKCGTKYKINFDKPYSYERDYDGWYVINEVTVEREAFTVL